MKTRKIWWFTPGNYKLPGLFFLFFLNIAFAVNGQNRSSFPDEYKIIFGDKYEEAEAYLQKESWITDSCIVQDVSPEFAKAIVFPEVIRFSAIQNAMEVQGLLTLYVQYGEKYANFSIGRFQMKPTFAEQIEKDILPTPPFDLSDTPGARLARVKRLNSPNWQVQYLIWFIQIMNHRFKNMQWFSDVEKLKFYATAYNCGYRNSSDYIRKKMAGKFFHTAIFKSDVYYNYGSISVDYYQTLMSAHKH